MCTFKAPQTSRVLFYWRYKAICRSSDFANISCEETRRGCLTSRQNDSYTHLMSQGYNGARLYTRLNWHNFTACAELPHDTREKPGLSSCLAWVSSYIRCLKCVVKNQKRSANNFRNVAQWEQVKQIKCCYCHWKTRAHLNRFKKKRKKSGSHDSMNRLRHIAKTSRPQKMLSVLSGEISDCVHFSSCCSVKSPNVTSTVSVSLPGDSQTKPSAVAVTPYLAEVSGHVDSFVTVGEIIITLKRHWVVLLFVLFFTSK